MTTHIESHEPARRLAVLRRERGMTQVQLAYLAGVSVGTISRIESGAVQPYRTTITALAAAIGCEPDQITLVRSGAATGEALTTTPERKEGK